MDIEELRKHVTFKEAEGEGLGQALVWLSMIAALVCSLATAFVAHPGWAAAGAILLLGLGLLGERALERRNFDYPPVTNAAALTSSQAATRQTETPAATFAVGEMQPVETSLTEAAGLRRVPSIPSGNSVPGIAAVSPANSISQRRRGNAGQANQTIVLPISGFRARSPRRSGTGGQSAHRIPTVSS